LRDAKLNDVDLSQAKLNRANLMAAKLNKANLRGVSLNCGQRIASSSSRVSPHWRMRRGLSLFTTAAWHRLPGQRIFRSYLRFTSVSGSSARAVGLPACNRAMALSGDDVALGEILDLAQDALSENDAAHVTEEVERLLETFAFRWTRTVLIIVSSRLQCFGST
jgi:hypothetical protein